MRRGRLFRSDHLGDLKPEEAQGLRALGITRVLDLRGATERAGAVCALPEVQVHSLAIEPTVMQVLCGLMEAGQTLTAAIALAQMKETYRGFVHHNTHRFAELFGHLLESGEPLVFHCTAGKDRTGFAAALILLALGVPESGVLHDYLLTNDRVQPPVSGCFGLPPEVASVLWRVQPEFLEAAFEAVNAEYGSVETYLRSGIGLAETGREHLRRLYLQG